MAVNYSRGGGKSVPKETLRYINQIANDITTTANRDLANIETQMGTQGTDGLPAVASTFIYDRRGSGTGSQGQYSLLDSTSTEVADGSAWNTITRIILNDSDENGLNAQATANVFVANGNHVRIFRDNNNWGFYTITSTSNDNGTFTLNLSFVTDEGMVNIPSGSDQTIFIGFDAAAGTQGDAAFGVNVVLDPNVLNQNTDGTFDHAASNISIIVSRGEQSVTINHGAFTLNANTFLVTPTRGSVTNQSLTIGSDSYQYDITFTNSNRTVTFRLETTSGVLIAQDTNTLTISARGERGETGAPGEAGTDGANVLVVYSDDAAGTNQSLTIGSNQFVQYVEYTGTAPTLPVSGTFVRFIGTDGVQGGQGDPGQSIYPIYSADSLGIDQSFTRGTRAFVTFFEATMEPTLPVTGQTFVRYIGTDGVDGMNGADGTNGMDGRDGTNGTNGVDGMDGRDGTNGVDGFNTATVNIYIRSSTEPTTRPTGDSTYTFSTGGLTFTTANGWSADVPSGSDPLWIRSAQAISRGATDTITSAEWSSVTQASATAVNGQDGFNQATVYLYQRNNTPSTAPAAPNQSATYNFATGDISPTNNNGWLTEIPSNTNGSVLWVVATSVVSRESQVMVAASEWSSPIPLTSDGVDGTNGTDGVDGTNGVDGADGTNGLNTATPMIFKRSSDMSDRPTAEARYDYATSTLRFDEIALPSPGTQLLAATANNGTYTAAGVLTVGGILSGVTTSDERMLVVVASGNTGLATGNYLVNFSQIGANFFRMNNIRMADGTAVAPPASDISPGVRNFQFTINEITPGGRGFTGTESNGWYVNEADVPPTGIAIHSRSVTVATSNSTFNVATTDWDAPIQRQGDAGNEPVNSATINLYQRTTANTAPADPSGTLTYTFETASLTTDNLNGWSVNDIPSGSGRYIWLITVTIASTSATHAISSSDWTDANLILTEAVDGTDGTNGADGTNGNIQNWIFRDLPRDITTLSTPAPSITIPAGWLDSPPGNPAGAIWASQGTQAEGTGNFTWGTPQRLSGVQGTSSRTDFAYFTNQPAQQTISVSGTRSNDMLTAQGGTVPLGSARISLPSNFNSGTDRDERQRITLDGNFNSGNAVGVYPNIPNAVELTGFNQHSYVTGNTYSFPTGGFINRQVTAGAWSWTPDGGNADDFSHNIAGRLVNTSGGNIDLSNMRFSITITINSLAPGASIDTAFFIGTLNPSLESLPTNLLNLLAVRTLSISSVGTYTFNSNNVVDEEVIANGGNIGLFLFHGLDDEQDPSFSYTINNIRISPTTELYVPSVGPAAYSLNLDTNIGASLNSNITGTFPANANVTTALATLRTAIQNTHPSVTVSNDASGSSITVDTNSVTNTSPTIDITDNDGSNTSASVSITTAGLPRTSWSFDPDIDNSFYAAGIRIDRTLFAASQTATQALTTMAGAIAALNSSITWDGNVDSTTDPNNPSVTIVLSANNLIRPSLTITQNTGSNTTPTVTIGNQSQYSVFDYANREIVTFSSAVSTTLDTDREFIVARIVDAIGDNVETPIDFIATRSGSTIVISANDTGAVTGMWRIDANHGGGNGNISFTTATIVRAGSATFTNASYPTGTLTNNDYIAAVPVGHNFIGERVVFWGEGQTNIDEPAVSTNSSDYAITRLN